MTPNSIPPDETERLRRVYSDYDRADFNQGKWSLTNPGNRAILQERETVIHQLLGEGGYLPLKGRRILEVGCNEGDVLAGMQRWGASPDHLVGIDLLPDHLRIGRELHPDLSFFLGNGCALPFRQESFDLVLLFTVLSSILDGSVARTLASEVRRVLRPGGAVVWYDFRLRSPSNPNVRPISRRLICDYFPDFELTLRSVTLVPPLARRLGRWTGAVYPLLARLPLLRSHNAGLLKKR